MNYLIKYVVQDIVHDLINFSLYTLQLLSFSFDRYFRLDEKLFLNLSYEYIHYEYYLYDLMMTTFL